MNKKSCPICSNPSELEYERSDIFLYRCYNCEHRFTIIKQNIQEQYDNQYYIDKHKNWFNNPDIGLYKKVAAHLVENNSKCILDVGCGNANLLKYLKSLPHDISLTGIDLSDVKEFDNVKIINQSFLDYEWASKYDMVTSLATIEHIVEVEKFVTKIHDKLKPGGIFFVMTMNDDSVLYRTSRLLNRIGLSKAFNRLYDKHHVNHFSHRSLKKILVAKGFSIKKIYLHNAPLKSLDIEHSNKIEFLFNKISVVTLFILGLLTKKTYLQSIVAQRV